MCLGGSYLKKDPYFSALAFSCEDAPNLDRLPQGPVSCLLAAGGGYLILIKRPSALDLTSADDRHAFPHQSKSAFEHPRRRPCGWLKTYLSLLP